MALHQQAAIQLFRSEPAGVHEWNRLRTTSRPPSLAGVRFDHGNGVGYLRGVNFSGCDLSGCVLGQLSMGHLDLSKANLVGAQFHGDIEHSLLEGAALNGAYFGEARFHRNDFSEANMAGVRGFWPIFSECQFRRTDFRDADIQGPTFVGNTFVEALLDRSTFRPAPHTSARCNNNVFWRCSLVATDVSELPFAGNLLASDLSAVRGIPSLHQAGPSDIAVQALLDLKVDDPVALLRGIGARDDVP